jgi:fumarylacetoacetate (FAA) hydrolase family protein
VARADVRLTVEGEDGYRLAGGSAMSRISRSPQELVAATIGKHHQYPDGVVLYLGTMFAPIEDRDTKGEGFTHKAGDIVTISSPRLGRLSNVVTTTDKAEPWTFGAAALMRNLAHRGLI